MSLRIDLKDKAPSGSDVLVCFARQVRATARGRRTADYKVEPIGAVPRFVAGAIASTEFEAERGASLSIPGRSENEPAYTLMFGLGEESTVTLDAVRRLGGQIAMMVEHLGEPAVDVLVSGSVLAEPENVEALAEGMWLGAYRYTLSDQTGASALERATLFATGAGAPMRAALRRAQDAGAGVRLARDLVNAPPNHCTPETLEETAERIAAGGARVERSAANKRPTKRKSAGGTAGSRLNLKVLHKKELERGGFGGLLAVNQGADIPARLICLDYRPNAPRAATVCFVGKGITFDTGGYSLKPSDGQVGMKADMAGGAAVLGLMEAVARLKPKVRVVGLVPTTQNFINGKAFTVDDVLHMHSGKTVEVGNTDAEGRLILADALSYASDEYEPDYMVDLATLTGACVIALGKNVCAGLMSPDDEFAALIDRAGQASGERVWRLPLWDEYRDLLRSKVADLKNTGGRAAGAISAAKFLQAFVTREQTRWAHVDIAGMSMSDRDLPHLPHGATGYGVRLGLAIVRELEAAASAKR